MKKIGLICVDCDSTWMLYNYLQQSGIAIDFVVIEKPVSKIKLIRARIKKLGLLQVLAMLVFQLTIPKLLKSISGKRVKQILEEYNCSIQKPSLTHVHYLTSINEKNAIQLLQDLGAHIILVNGTRILSKSLLQKVKSVFINTHLGITPQYRGVHGGYWAMYNNDAAQVGTTIHLVDSGIDTGGILKQNVVQPTSTDNFYTYPYLQMASSLPNMVTLLQQDNLKPEESNPSSVTKLYYHPTIWQYLKARAKGIK
jgi:folate-dependent phosphoribosylglycinamide formyltransferase PurN